MTIRLDPEDAEISTLFRLAGDMRGKAVLEVGCGDGRLTWRYGHRPALLHALDPKTEKIAAAKRALPPQWYGRVKFFATDLHTFHPNPPQLYDLAILAWSL
ncbi:MAG: class I SAM-dependent methyltransferase [Chloroflexi bacterium]|nr:class I SAM-dependent methyltransferase [Chloroflexota bacterium]MBP8058143.1 class I SAM-dependent methyltransferase [Chloroflexota bacterium]